MGFPGFPHVALGFAIQRVLTLKVLADLWSSGALLLRSCKVCLFRNIGRRAWHEIRGQQGRRYNEATSVMQVCFGGVVLLPFSHPHARAWVVVRCGCRISIIAVVFIAFGFLLVFVFHDSGVQLSFFI